MSGRTDSQVRQPDNPGRTRRHPLNGSTYTAAMAEGVRHEEMVRWTADRGDSVHR